MNADMTSGEKLPDFLSTLFWEYDFQSLDVNIPADSIIGRVMEKGAWAAMVWLRHTYSKERLASFLEHRGVRMLPLRKLNYWAFVSRRSQRETR